MDTPIFDFVKKYVSDSPLRLHMPGHKGQSFIGSEEFDITEITGADSLYCADGIILQSEQNASKLFESARTIYSTEGSSLCVRAMLYLACLGNYGSKNRPLIAAARNVHKSFIYSAALLDFDVLWLYPDENSLSLCSCVITPDVLDKALCQSDVKPCAVYITSPDYLGIMSDIDSLSKVCKKHNVLLLVDNAHGAYTKFLPKNLHPIFLGADICCDSAHKTLPVLTGGAYLHFSGNVTQDILKNAKSAMAMFGSTSPSYLILSSLDKANSYLIGTYREKLYEFTQKIEALRERLRSLGFDVLSTEPLKITIKTKPYGYTGIEVGKFLESNSIFIEFCDNDFLVMMFTPETDDNSLEKLYDVLSYLPRKPEILQKAPTISKAQSSLSIREALFSKKKKVPTADALGKILADTNVHCPPAIPIAVCGEKLGKTEIQNLLYYNTKEIFIVNED